jgi:hypothetical protein
LEIRAGREELARWRVAASEGNVSPLVRRAVTELLGRRSTSTDPGADPFGRAARALLVAALAVAPPT